MVDRTGLSLSPLPGGQTRVLNTLTLHFNLTLGGARCAPTFRDMRPRAHGPIKFNSYKIPQGTPVLLFDGIRRCTEAIPKLP